METFKEDRGRHWSCCEVGTLGCLTESIDRHAPGVPGLANLAANLHLLLGAVFYCLWSFDCCHNLDFDRCIGTGVGRTGHGALGRNDLDMQCLRAGVVVGLPYHSLPENHMSSSDHALGRECMSLGFA